MSAVVERCCDETGRRHEGGEVRGKRAVRHGVAAAAADGLQEGVREAGADKRSAPQRGGEVGLLVHRVEDVAGHGINEKDVGQSVLLENAAEQGMETGMNLRVGGLIVGRVEQQF